MATVARHPSANIALLLKQFMCRSLLVKWFIMNLKNMHECASIAQIVNYTKIADLQAAPSLFSKKEKAIAMSFPRHCWQIGCSRKMRGKLND